ncbi:hypothetical protein CONLIGDRAFT_140595 [Coniochaeta ligniaria NRRL 30616]|uniref:Uncharacterized protein n=1 Tax=Coniochaeta ligniaria NRRL 30616 TaxID=1408157 RepID=A0A1J7I896_9PEZI|nr:hypothetical protein CONLIGDRAFT_140595 [Coniochaeta ligniaria NRRL 30616]
MAMTLTAILRPNWVSFHVDFPPQSSSAIISRSLGLHQSCTSDAYQTTCRPFPTESDCAREGSFCAMWRTVGWLMSLATIMELATLVGIVVILSGGKARREAGWRVLAGLLAVVGLVLFSGMAVVAYLFDNHNRFAIPGWRLDTSWVLCTVSGTIVVLSAVGVAISAYVLPPEDGYELLPDQPGV